MKKILFFAMFACMAISATAQKTSLVPTNEEISNIINMSAEANKLQAGIKDPNLIQPGQVLTFTFEDGTSHQIGVEKGDNQWGIVKNKISGLIEDHGKMVDPEELGADDAPAPQVPVEESSLFWDFLETYPVWSLLIFCVIILFAFWLFKTKPWKSENQSEPTKFRGNRVGETDPVLSGVPIREGGITNDEDARARMEQIAQAQYHDDFDLKDVTPGYLHGQNVEVSYGDETTQRHTFRNQPAYRGTVVLHGPAESAPQEIYFLQGCANDVRTRRYMNGSSELRFTTEPITEDQLITEVVNTPVSQESTQQAVVRSTPTSIANVMPIDINQMVQTLANTGQAFRIDVAGVMIDVDAKKEFSLLNAGNHVNEELKEN